MLVLYSGSSIRFSIADKFKIDINCTLIINYTLEESKSNLCTMLGIKNVSLSVLVYALSLKIVTAQPEAQRTGNTGVVGADGGIGDDNTLTSRGVDAVSTRGLSTRIILRMLLTSL